ncbi:transcription initiation protein [Jiangella ureilytica]|uniref:Transcription initiation protein n=1 Tax=Jiangella ureilytica TaxID=2530374 RepID=A0A4R4RPJ2_9ACTN|nr:YciI family protein [Jiangella ureilytica]TDC51757.1 transcription initiation protein [Jiangella ureilytica]
MSKYMLIMRPTDAALAAGADVDFDEIIATIGAFNQELIRAGVLLAAEGLDPDESVVVDFTGEEPVVSDGPYGETKELFSGYYVLEVSSKEEAVEWAKRIPYSQATKVEIRRVTRIDELPQDNEWIRKERAWREATGQL